MSAADWELVQAISRRKPSVPTASSVSTIFLSNSAGPQLGAATIAQPALSAGALSAVSNTYSGYMQLQMIYTTALPIVGYAIPQSPIVQYLDRSVQIVQDAIDELISPLPNGGAIAARMHELVGYAKDEYPETDIPSYTSIAALRRFLTAHARLAAPSISLLPSGSIWLSWRDGAVRAGLSIFRDGSASFGLLLPGRVRPTHINFAGSLETVIPRIVREESARWIFPH